MRLRPVQIEIMLVGVLLCLGFFLRCVRGEFEVVEHFDEGVYASVLWYDDLFGTAWPGREFFAPPGLPLLIELASYLPGLYRTAPFLPGLLLGAATPLLFWWTARFWFGRPAGLFALVISACSEFHVIYSRMALTDVPALSLVLAAVAAGSLAIQRDSRRLAVAAGCICGLAWWIKYTGWLPLAIIASGSGAWWLAEGRKTFCGLRLLVLQLLMGTAALVTFLPCWWSLQSIGGYSAVAANHVGYVAGWSQWSQRLGEQLAFQMQLDGLWGAASAAAALTLAAITAGLSRVRFTWNAGPVSAAENSSGSAWPVVVGLWLRVIPGALGIGLLCLRVHTPVILGCVAIGGLSGMFLWPIRNSSVGAGGGGSAKRSGLAIVPGEASGPGFWLAAAWVAGLLLATPFYQPYSRLMLPLIAGVWLAAAGGVGWWLECQLMAAVMPRQLSGFQRAVQLSGRLLVVGLLMIALGGSLLVPDGNGRPVLVTLDELRGDPVIQDRRDIVRAAGEVSRLCGSLAGEQSERAVLCVYGEPALAWHLSAAGMAAVPVSHLRVEGDGVGTPVFLIFGPNAKRTPGFWEQWQLEEIRFEWLGDVLYEPGRVTLMDLFSAKYLSTHAEALQQRFEVYRVRSSASPRP
ncbi:MAG: hypothetical protein RLZZ436_3001 [Planctomycetota bacterium]